MNNEELDKLWKVLSSATNINNLPYDESVVIGSVFGQLKSVIEKQQKEIENNKPLKEGVEKFVDKNYGGGAKSDREDYGTMVSCKDMWELRELVKNDYQEE